MTAFRRALAGLLAVISLLALGLTTAAGAAESAPEDASAAEEDGGAAPFGQDLPVTWTSDEPPAPEEEAVPPMPETTPGPAVTGEPDLTPEPQATPEAQGTPDPETTPGEGVPPLPETSQEPEFTPEAETTLAPESTSPPENLDPSGEPSGEATEEPAHKQWPWTEPGNSVVSILGGGRQLVSGFRFYYSENGSLYLNGTVLASVSAMNLNLSEGWLYYSVDNTVYRVPEYGGGVESVYAATGSIREMYVMGQELRFVSDGSVYSYDMGDGALEALESPEGVLGLIPTEFGNLYLTGAVFNYTLWANGTALYSGIDSCYTDSGWLVVVIGGQTYQTALAPLFDGTIRLQDFTLHDSQAVGSGLSEEAQLASEAAFFDSAQYASMQAALTPAENGVAAASTSHVLTKTLTSNQQNIVLRARQMAEVLWSPQLDRYAWGGNDTSYVSTKRARGITLKAEDGTDTSTSYAVFKAGKTYKGIPYSQAVSTGYVGWGISIKGFLSAVNNPQSAFYSGYSTYERQAPYYGSDCSGFVSYAWDLPLRCTCTSLIPYSKLVGSDINMLQIGDCLNNPSSHVVLVTDLGYDAYGNIVSVEITEQTPYKMRVTCYGEKIAGKDYDFTGYLSYVTSYFLRGGYTIYRRDCSSRPNVREPEDEAGLSYAPAPTMSVKTAGPSAATVTLSHSTGGAVIYYTTDGSTPTEKSTRYTGPFTVSKACTIRAMAVVPGFKDCFPLNTTLESVSSPKLETGGEAAYLDHGTYYVKAGDKLTFTSDSGTTIYYTTDGSTPTLKSRSVKSGTATSLTVSSTMTVKAFAAKDGSCPSALVTMKVQPGKIYTVQVNDPYGFLQVTGFSGVLNGRKFSVLEGKDLTFTIRSVSGYTLGALRVDGKAVSSSSGKYTFSNVRANHTISAEIKLPFNDVNGSSWYAEAVAFVSGKGFFNGITASTFSPNSSMTRAMFITVLGRFASPGSTIANWTGRMGVTNGYDIIIRSDTTTSSGRNGIIEAAGQYIAVTNTVTNGKDGGTWYQVNYNGTAGYVRSTLPSNGKVLMDVCQFNDLTGSVSYCSGYAQWAYLNDIIEGASATRFNSGGAISRQDICVILYNYLTKYRGASLSTASKSFVDGGNISAYARNAVNAMANIGIVEGDAKGYFHPKNAATRAEVAAMFMRLYNYTH